MMIRLMAAALMAGGFAAAANAAETPAKPLQAAVKPVLTILQPGQAFAVFGAAVTAAGDTEIGKIWNILVDPDHHPIAAIIDYGGFMGVGHRKIAISWAALHFVQKGEAFAVRIDLTPEQLGDIPEVPDGPGAITLGNLPASAAPK